MKIPKLKMNDVIVVLWIDANSEYRKWMTKDLFLDISPVMEILSIGFFIEIKDGYIRAVADISESEAQECVVNRTTNIPISCIKSIKKIGG